VNAGPPPPPYLGQGAHNLLISYDADEAAVRALVPDGLELASNRVTLNMYTVRHGVGIPAYTRSYIWADLVGLDSWDGTKGRYVMLGWADPGGFRQIATDVLHWPAEPGVTHLEVDEPSAIVTATLTAGSAPLITAQARRVSGRASQVAASLLPYVFVDADARSAGRPALPGDIGINAVPFIGDASELQPLSVEMHTQDGHPLASLRPITLIQAIEVQHGALGLGVIQRVKT
jgi:hypothetical protein